MRYEDTVRKVCGENWKTVNAQERDGGFGVAIMIAYLRGTRPTISEMAGHLGTKAQGEERPDVTADDIVAAFSRLAKNGVFMKDWAARKDRALLGQTDTRDSHDRAWAHIAAMAGGFIGITY